MPMDTTPNIRYYNNQPYQILQPGALLGMPGFGMGGPHAMPGTNINQKLFDGLVQQGVLKPYQQPQMQAAPAPQQSMTPQGPQALQNKLNRLTINASDALYGGLLGYNPKPITSPTGNQYQPPNPQGGFRFPFGLLNGMGGQQ